MHPLGGFYVSSICAIQLLDRRGARVLEIHVHKGKALKTYHLLAGSSEVAQVYFSPVMRHVG